MITTQGNKMTKMQLELIRQAHEKAYRVEEQIKKASRFTQDAAKRKQEAELLSQGAVALEVAK